MDLFAFAFGASATLAVEFVGVVICAYVATKRQGAAASALRKSMVEAAIANGQMRVVTNGTDYGVQ